MLKSLRICKKELKQLQNTNIVKTNQTFLLFNLVVAVLFFFLQSSPNLTYARANFEYLKENHIRALKILTNNQQSNSSLISLQTNSSHCFYNNLSCIHFHLHKSAFALFYMRRALAENNRLLIEHLNSNDKQLIIHNINRKYEILYNLGIQLLFKRQPLPAFECLSDVIHIYSNNIRLWLRLAECCIMIYRSSNEDIFKLEEKLKCVLQSIGNGFHHKLILGNCNTSTSSKKSLVTNGNENCSMEFALYCLKNALTSLPIITEADLQYDENEVIF
jgi:CCR4-NOT transcription complex subunit 10